MLLYKPRTLYSTNFNLTKPQISIPISLVLIREDNIIVNRVLYQDLVAYYTKQLALDFSRFKSIGDNVSFPGSITLKHLSRIFNIVYYIRRPENNLALYKYIDKQLRADCAQFEKLYRKQKEKAIIIIEIRYQELQNQEIDIFKGNKSYFQCKELCQVPCNKDPEYLSTLDELEVIR